MANPRNDSLVLRRRLEALPQELYDIIYDLTFTAEPGVRQLGTVEKVLEFVTPSRDPYPHLLKVDRRSRALFANSYYGQCSTFVIYDGQSLADWLSSLTNAHRTLIADVRCVYSRATPDTLDHSDSDYPPQRYWRDRLYEEGLADENLLAKIQVNRESRVTRDLEGYTSMSLEEAKQGRPWQAASSPWGYMLQTS